MVECPHPQALHKDQRSALKVELLATKCLLPSFLTQVRPTLDFSHDTVAAALWNGHRNIQHNVNEMSV